MRLTLRTLLAYLDDRLSPANAREIGQKISNSPFATELAERIRDVKRRRRLAAPEKPLPVLDANLIAEYLDDQLTPELVARVEQEVLASDPMLAEVAASHEVLGMLRDPVTIGPRLRDRLYGLDPTGNLDFVRVVSHESEQTRADSGMVPVWRPLTTRVVTSRRVSGVIAAALIILWLGAIASDSELLGLRPRSAPVAERDQGANGFVADANDAEASADPDVPEDSAQNTAEVAVTEKEPTSVAPADIDAATNADVAAVVAETSEPVADIAVTPEPDPVVVPDIPVITEVPEVPPASFYLQSDNRIVLSLDEEQGRWTTLAQLTGEVVEGPAGNQIDCSPFLGKQWFGIPEPFELGITTSSGGWSVRLPGPGIVRIHKGELAGLDILSGRIVLTAVSEVAWNDASPPRFALGNGLKTFELVLQSPDTRLGIEADPVATLPAGDANAPVVESDSILPLDADLHVRLTVVSGSAILKTPDDDTEVPLAEGQVVSWSILDMSEFTAFNRENRPPVAAMPAWLFPSDAVDVPETTELKKQLLTALQQGESPGDSVLGLLEDRNPQAGVLAVQVLSLTRDVERLLAVIFESRDEAVHREAIDGLSVISASSMNGRRAIRESLETRLPMTEVDMIQHLIEGLTLAEAADAEVSATLIELLGSDRLVTRTLTIYRLEQLTGDRMGFHPDAEASRRREAIRRWQKHLDRNQGMLIP